MFVLQHRIGYLSELLCQVPSPRQALARSDHDGTGIGPWALLDKYTFFFLRRDSDIILVYLDGEIARPQVLICVRS